MPTKNVLEDKVNDATTKSPNAQRDRIVRWDDEAGRTVSGREFLDVMLRGELPLPLSFHPEGSASGAAIRERNQ